MKLLHPSSAAALLLLVGAWLPAQGTPPGRYELGRRLRAFEVAWAGSPAARPRALEDLAEATAAFIQFDQDRVAVALDRARLRLSSTGEPSPAALWAASLDLMPQARFVAQGTRRLRLRLASAYRRPGRIVPGARLSVTVVDAAGETLSVLAERSVNGISFGFEIQIGELGPGDHRLRADVSSSAPGGGVVLEQVFSVARDPRGRLRRVRQILARHRSSRQRSLRATVDGQVMLLERLLEGRPPETDVEAWALLLETEAAAAALRSGQSYYGASRSGSTWLQLATARGWIPARVFVPQVRPEAMPRPLVIALHGVGGSENFFFEAYGSGAIVELCRARGWTLVAPRCSLLTGIPVAGVVDAVAELLPVGPVLLVGHSLGARQAVSAAIAAPQRYRALALLGGGGRGALRRITHLPILIGAGQHDFALSWARRLHDQLERLGSRNLDWRVYPGVEHHTVVAEALPDVFAFFDAVLD